MSAVDRCDWANAVVQLRPYLRTKMAHPSVRSSLAIIMGLLGPARPLTVRRIVRDLANNALGHSATSTEAAPDNPIAIDGLVACPASPASPIPSPCAVIFMDPARPMPSARWLSGSTSARNHPDITTCTH